MRGLGLAPLAAAVSNAGGLGMLSAHTHRDSESLRREIERARSLTDKPFGVNLTVLPSLGSRDFDGYARVICEMRVPAVETSGGNPAKYIALFKQHGIAVLHKVSSSLRFALKAQELGADAVTLHRFSSAQAIGQGPAGPRTLPAAAEASPARDVLQGIATDGARGGARYWGCRDGHALHADPGSSLHEVVKQRMLRPPCATPRWSGAACATRPGLAGYAEQVLATERARRKPPGDPRPAGCATLDRGLAARRSRVAILRAVAGPDR